MMMKEACWCEYQDVAFCGNRADTLAGNIVVALGTLDRDLGAVDDTAH